MEMGNEVQGHTVQSTRFARTSAPTQHAETKIPPVRRMVCSSGTLEADIRLRKKPSRKAIGKPGHYVKYHGSTQVPFHRCRGRDCRSKRQTSYSQKAHTRCTVENAAKEVLRGAFGESVHPILTLSRDPNQGTPTPKHRRSSASSLSALDISLSRNDSTEPDAYEPVGPSSETWHVLRHLPSEECLS